MQFHCRRNAQFFLKPFCTSRLTCTAGIIRRRVRCMIPFIDEDAISCKFPEGWHWNILYCSIVNALIWNVTGRIYTKKWTTTDGAADRCTAVGYILECRNLCLRNHYLHGITGYWAPVAHLTRHNRVLGAGGTFNVRRILDYGFISNCYLNTNTKSLVH